MYRVRENPVIKINRKRSQSGYVDIPQINADEDTNEILP